MSLAPGDFVMWRTSELTPHPPTAMMRVAEAYTVDGVAWVKVLCVLPSRNGRSRTYAPGGSCMAVLLRKVNGPPVRRLAF